MYNMTHNQPGQMDSGSVVFTVVRSKKIFRYLTLHTACLILTYSQYSLVMFNINLT